MVAFFRLNLFFEALSAILDFRFTILDWADASKNGENQRKMR
jgi:hypothetical protein